MPGGPLCDRVENSRHAFSFIEIPESSANLLFPVFKQLISISKGLIRHVIASLPLFLLSVGRSSVKEPFLIQSTTDSLPDARD